MRSIPPPVTSRKQFGVLNRSKFFLSTLIAAAAMTAPAYAETYTVTGAVKTTSSSSVDLVPDGGTVTDSSENTISSAISLTADDTVIFNGATGYLPGWYNGSFVANIVLKENGLTINNGTSTAGTTQVFSGALSGAGTFTTGNHAAPKATTYVFSGNATKFTGAINASNQTSGGIQFGNAETYSSSATVENGVISNISGTGAITAGNKLTYNYAASESYTTLSIDNSSISAGTLTFQGGASYSVSSAVTAETLNLSAGTLTLKGNTTVSSALTVASGTTLTNTGTLNLSGATVSLKSAITNTGTLNLSGATVSLTSDITNTETGTVTLDGSTTFVLSPSEPATLFSGAGTVAGWDSLDYKNFTNSDGVFSGRTVIDKDNYTVTLGIAYSDMVWNNASGDGKWNSSSENWTRTSTSANLAFVDGDSVTFSTESSVVTVEGTVTPTAMTVSAATSFTGTGWTINAGTLNASADISISGGTVVADTVNVTSATSFTGTGWTINAGTLNASADISLSGGTVVVSGTFTIANGVSVSGDGKIDLGSSGKLSGTLSEEWKGTVSLSNRGSNESLSSYGNAKSTIEINGFAGYFSDQKGGTVSSDLVVNGTLEINNGYSNTTFTISGDVSGDEEACFIFNPEGTTQNLMFSGEVELYSIQILTGGTTTFRGKSTTATNFTVSGGSGVVFNGSASTIGTFTQKAGTVTFSSGTENTINTFTQETGTLNLSGTKSLITTLTASGTVNITSGTNTIGVLTQNSGTATFSGGTNTIGVLTQKSGTTTFSGGTSNIENLVQSAGETMFSSGKHTVGKLTQTAGTLYVSGGDLTIYGGEMQSVIFNGTGGSLAFSKHESAESESGYSVTSISTATLSDYTRTITVGEGVSVNAGTFSNTHGIGSLTVSGTLDISESLEFATSENDSGNIITGTGTVKTKKFIVGGSGTYSIQGGVRVEIGNGGIDGSGTLNLGDATLGVSETWPIVTRAFNLVSADVGTTIDTMGNRAEISGVISGDGALNVSGTGTLVLFGGNSYSGGTTIGAGATLLAENTAALGSGSLAVNGLLELGNNEFNYSVKNLSGSGTVRLEKDDNSVFKATVTITSEKDSTFSGKFDDERNGLSSSHGYGLFIVKDGSATLTLSGESSLAESSGFTINAGTLSVARAGALGSGKVETEEGATLEIISANGTFANVVSGGGAVSVKTTGTVTLSGNNEFSGGLSVVSGTLVASATALGTGAISVGSGAALNLSGENVKLYSTIQNSGTISIEDTTTFVLDNMTATDGVYTLISGTDGVVYGWENLTNKSFTSASGTTLHKCASNYTVFAGIGDLTWVGDEEGAGTWNERDANWTINDNGKFAYADGDSVVFAKDGANIAVEDSVSPNAMTVSANTTFSGRGEIILAAPGNLTFGSDATLSLDSDVTLDMGLSSSEGEDNPATLSAENIIGTGTIKWGNIGGKHYVTLALNDGFTGTLQLSGKLRVDTWGALKNVGTVNLDGAWLYAGAAATINKAVVITDTVPSGTDDNAGVNLYIAGSVTFSESFDASGKIVKVASGTTMFSEETTIGTLNISGGTVVFNGDAGVATLSASGQTVSVGETGNLKVTSTSTIGTLNSSGMTMFSGETTIGTLNISSGTVTSSGETTIGTLNISGGTVILGVDDYSGDTPNSTATLSATGKSLSGSLTIKGGAKVTVATGNDALNYEGTNTITVANGGELYFDTARWTVGSSNKIVLSGGKITGTGEGSNGAVDFYGNNTLASTGGLESTVEAPIRLRGNLTVSVGDDSDADSSLVVSGAISQHGVNRALEKTGKGALTLSGTNTYAGGTTISAGMLVAANASALGAGAVKISGGQLKVSSGVAVSNSITVVLGDTLDAAVITGDGSLGETITLDYVAPAENAALMIATETTTKTYALLSGNVGLNLTADSFALGSGWESGWNVSDYAYDTETGIGTLTLTIPEPSAFGLLAGAGALALCVSRRRRRE